MFFVLSLVSDTPRTTSGLALWEVHQISGKTWFESPGTPELRTQLDEADCTQHHCWYYLRTGLFTSEKGITLFFHLVFHGWGGWVGEILCGPVAVMTDALTSYLSVDYFPDTIPFFSPISFLNFISFSFKIIKISRSITICHLVRNIMIVLMK